MSSWFFLSITFITAISIFLSVYFHRPEFPPLQIELDDYWKNGDPANDDDSIRKYIIDISDEKIEHFKKLVKNERSSASAENQAFFEKLKNVVLDFDWKQHQHFLNTFKQYKTEIEGLDVHFLRVSTPIQGKKQRLVPLLMLHGFPGSFWDFFKIIPILSNPSRHGFDFGVKESIQFDIIVPSLPGFLFSEKPEKSGFDAVAIARILQKLMKRLEISEYFLHGGEGFGVDVASLMASLYPSKVTGLHLSNPFLRPTFSTYTLAKYSWQAFKNGEEDESNLTDITEYFKLDKFAYPVDYEAFGTSLQNSATGTMQFIANRWKQMSSKDGKTSLEKIMTFDEIATEIYLYWLTDTLPNALSIINQSYNFESYWLSGQVTIPTSISYSSDSPWKCTRDILEDKYFNITRESYFLKGGSFHHLQDPMKTAEDIFQFVEIQLL